MLRRRRRRQRKHAALLISRHAAASRTTSGKDGCWIIALIYDFIVVQNSGSQAKVTNLGHPVFIPHAVPQGTSRQDRIVGESVLLPVIAETTLVLPPVAIATCRHGKEYIARLEVPMDQRLLVDIRSALQNLGEDFNVASTVDTPFSCFLASTVAIFYVPVKCSCNVRHLVFLGAALLCSDSSDNKFTWAKIHLYIQGPAMAGAATTFSSSSF